MLAVVAAILSMVEVSTGNEDGDDISITHKLIEDPTKCVDDESQLHTPQSTRVSSHHDGQKQDKEDNELSNF